MPAAKHRSVPSFWHFIVIWHLLSIVTRYREIYGSISPMLLCAKLLALTFHCNQKSWDLWEYLSDANGSKVWVQLVPPVLCAIYRQVQLLKRPLKKSGKSFVEYLFLKVTISPVDVRVRSLFQLRIQESLYSVLLEDWLRVIPRDQIVFIRFEDYAQNITRELKRVHQHLGLSELENKSKIHLPCCYCSWWE